jgi:predicted helicase
MREFLTLEGIPPETFEYRLGNRSALEWVIGQYQVDTGQRGGITNDPSRPADSEYIVRLFGQVITV